MDVVYIYENTILWNVHHDNNIFGNLTVRLWLQEQSNSIHLPRSNTT